MGAIKNYQLRLLEFSEHDFGQKAIEHAIKTRVFVPQYDLKVDYATIGENYDAYCEQYRAFVNTPRVGTSIIVTYETKNPSKPANLSTSSGQRRQSGNCPAKNWKLEHRAEV